MSTQPSRESSSLRVTWAVFLLMTACCSEQSGAQTPALTIRKQCERSAVESLIGTNASGLSPAVFDLQISEVESILSNPSGRAPAQLKIACQNYVIKTRQLHQNCPCPL